MKKLLLSLSISAITGLLYAQDYLAKNEHFFTLPNRLNLFVAEDSMASDLSVALVFNYGSFLEDNNYDGLSILYEKILLENVKRNLSGISGYRSDSASFSIFTETSFEHVLLLVKAPQYRLNEVLKAICQSVTTPVDSQDLIRAIALSNTLHNEQAVNPLMRLDSLIGSVLWERHHSKRLFINAWNDSTAASLPERLLTMSQQYFCAANALLILKGNVKARKTEETVKEMFSGWKKCTINRAIQFPGYNYRTLLSSSQLVIEDSLLSAPFFEIAFQGPTPFEGMKKNYCSLTLAELFTNPASKTHRYFTDSCNIDSLYLKNDMAQFLSQLTFYLLPDTPFISDGFACFSSFLTQENDSVNNLLIDSAELEFGKTLLVEKFKKIKSNNSAHVLLIGKYWTSINLNSYSTFEDSVNSITLSEMQDFLDNCLRKRCSVAGLAINPVLRKASSIDSVFTPTATSVSAYRINFLKNSARFAGAADDSVFNSLVQFLKLNPQVKIKVNGMCHRSELLEMQDAAMLTWVRAQEHFLLNPPSLVQKKKYRLDVYRALTVIKKLTESGITFDRLFGTGNLVRAPEDPEASQSVNFSVIF